MANRTVIKVLPVLLLVVPAMLPPQMPPQPAKLVIYSEPSGAMITINGQPQRRTNATFIVSPGNYQILVTNSSPALNCSKSVTPSAGETVTLTCTAGGWK
jgi:hypothetical protein